MCVCASSDTSSLAPGAAVLPFSRVDQSRADGAVCHGTDVWGPFMLLAANPSWGHIGRGLYHRHVPFREGVCGVLLVAGGRSSWQLGRPCPPNALSSVFVFGISL